MILAKPDLTFWTHNLNVSNGISICVPMILKR
jgi:hypothetical protein